MMASLRDLGYELTDAVADIVDNSVTAKATRVSVKVGFSGKESWIRISDNGAGMSAAKLTEAMRYGAERDYDESDLGKYGLGMKTASLSQCTKLTVASRVAGGRVEIRRWDLDSVRSEWDQLRLRVDECRPELLEPLDRHGTVVMWENLDRVLDYRVPSGHAAETGLLRLTGDVAKHLAMVFHRFLAGEARRSAILRIMVGEESVSPWDPFARDEKHTRHLPEKTLEITRDGKTHEVRILPFILPNESEFSTHRAKEEASGPNKWNRQQGFYIYRGDRMIQSGGWNRIKAPDEHTKLARIAVLYSPKADSCFEINVPKMTIKLPPELRPEFEALAKDVSAKANKAYRGDGPKSSQGSRIGEPSRAYGTSHRGARPIPERPMARRVVAILEEELGNQPKVLVRLLKALAHLDEVFQLASHKERIVK